VTTTLFVLAAVLAVGDWLAVERRLTHLEYILKPLALALLVGAAATANLYFDQWWVVAALGLGLLGDVGLMLSDDRKAGPDLPFLLGLGSFGLGHVCYIAAFLRFGIDGPHVVDGVLIVLGVAVLCIGPVLSGARRVGGIELSVVVAAYAGLLSAMAVIAIGTGLLLTAIGGLLFLISDTLIGTQRFVRPLPHGDLAVMVTYHAAQILMVAGLVLGF
jgi:uncharacterized membrane protein YhhN